MIENLVLSFPKSGRTWIRVFIIYYEYETGFRSNILYKHSEDDKFDRRLLLVRHPCDILVSSYFQYKYRSRNKTRKKVDLSSMKNFIRSHYGAEHLSINWRRWIGFKGEQFEVRYEDLFNNMWPDILEWFGIEVIEDSVLTAHNLCEFNRLRSNLHEFENHKLAEKVLGRVKGGYTSDPNENPDSHKFRRGKIGGYLDYLDEDDIRYIFENVPEGKRWYDYA